MKTKLDIIFDWKVMGVVAYVPIAITLLLACICATYIGAQNFLEHVTRILEYSFPIFGAWWSIFIFQDILEEQGSETILSYPVSTWNLGILRTGIFFVFYLILLFTLLVIIQLWSNEKIIYSLFMQLGIESLFFAGLGFASMALCSNSGWAMVIVIVYSTAQILTKGTLFPVANIYLFNEEIIRTSQLMPLLLKTLLIGLVLWVLAQIMLSNYKSLK